MASVPPSDADAGIGAKPFADAPGAWPNQPFDDVPQHLVWLEIQGRRHEAWVTAITKGWNRATPAAARRGRAVRVRSDRLGYPQPTRSNTAEWQQLSVRQPISVLVVHKRDAALGEDSTLAVHLPPL